jgi:hypothetical protein
VIPARIRPLLARVKKLPDNDRRGFFLTVMTTFGQQYVYLQSIKVLTIEYLCRLLILEIRQPAPPETPGSKRG